MLARVAIDFRRELVLDDRFVLVRVRLARIGTSSLTLREEVIKLDGTVSAEAEAVVVARDKRDRPLAPAHRHRASCLRKGADLRLRSGERGS